MKKWTFKVTIEDGSDEFWDSLQGLTGIAAVKDNLRYVIEEGLGGAETEIELLKFEMDESIQLTEEEIENYDSHWYYLKPAKPLPGDDRPWKWNVEKSEKDG